MARSLLQIFAVALNRIPNRARPMVLVIDDDQESSETLADFLALKGYVVQRISNCRDAFVYVDNTQTRSTLIFLDLVMPVLDGASLAAPLCDLWQGSHSHSGPPQELVRWVAKSGSRYLHRSTNRGPPSQPAERPTIRSARAHQPNSSGCQLTLSPRFGRKRSLAGALGVHRVSFCESIATTVARNT
jgi:hypothetical protein